LLAPFKTWNRVSQRIFPYSESIVQHYLMRLPCTGYAKALHKAAKEDKSGKYGFFTYPEDNTSGEFTYVSDNAACVVTIYPHDK